jgi:hypothetical protein
MCAFVNYLCKTDSIGFGISISKFQRLVGNTGPLQYQTIAYIPPICMNFFQNSNIILIPTPNMFIHTKPICTQNMFVHTKPIPTQNMIVHTKPIPYLLVSYVINMACCEVKLSDRKYFNYISHHRLKIHPPIKRIMFFYTQSKQCLKSIHPLRELGFFNTQSKQFLSM